MYLTLEDMLRGYITAQDSKSVTCYRPRTFPERVKKVPIEGGDIIATRKGKKEEMEFRQIPSLLSPPPLSINRKGENTTDAYLWLYAPQSHSKGGWGLRDHGN